VKTHVLDASAVLAVLAAEPGWEQASRYLDGGLLCSVNFGEVLCKVADFGSDPAATASDLVEYGVVLVDFTAPLAAYFPQLREEDRRARQRQAFAGVPARRRRRLSTADLCCLALALDRAATVVTGDSHWRALEVPLRFVDCRAQ
jgi:PIN domain nuclease of toxin-antitoxin system